MGVYIKGMEMPTSCRACPLATRFFDGEDVCAMLGTYVHDRDREDDCPLVPVPPHGDLVDRSKIEYTYQMQGGVLITSNKIIGRLPIIIPAEESE